MSSGSGVAGRPDTVDDLDPASWMNDEMPTVDEFLQPAAKAAGVDVEEVAKPQYPSLDRWVEEWLAPVMRRRLVGAVHWCPHWWAHPEAVDRLGALWAAWETAFLEGGAAPSHWWLGHLDPHWNVLTSTYGPFASCSATEHSKAADRLPCDPIPTTTEETDP